MLKRILPLLAVFLCCLLPVSADFIMTQEIDGMGQKTTLTLKIKGDQIRVDVNPQMSTIVNGATGEIASLMHQQKMVVRMSGDQLKAMTQAAQAQAGGAVTTNPEIKATGKTEKINGYDTEEYIVTQGNVVSHAWVAKDYPNGKAVLDALGALSKGPLKDIAGAGSVDSSALPGLPLKTVVEVNGQTYTTVLLQSVQEATIDPAEFTVPADYKTMEMPGAAGK